MELVVRLEARLLALIPQIVIWNGLDREAASSCYQNCLCPILSWVTHNPGVLYH